MLCPLRWVAAAALAAMPAMACVVHEAASYSVAQERYTACNWLAAQSIVACWPMPPPAIAPTHCPAHVCQVAATRDLRAMVNWPGLLELLEEEGVESVPTDGVRYWLARMGGDFQVGQLLDGWMEVAV